MQRTKWTERHFTFDFPVGWLPNILERLRGTEARIATLAASLSGEQLEYKPSGVWSIKEHIGHLADLEDLHEGRIDDFIERRDTLRPADMSNRQTNAAGHQNKSLDELITGFSNRRKRFVERLEQLDDQTHSFRSLHPRLQVMMRPVDVAFFTAEHDDHHLASMRAIAIHSH